MQTQQRCVPNANTTGKHEDTVVSDISPLPVSSEPALTLWRRLPAALIGLRLLLGPLLFWHACQKGHSGTGDGWLVAGIVAAFVSDVFDGILARRMGVATEKLRVADSWADGCFYFWLCLCAWRLYPGVVYAFRMPLGFVVSLQLLSDLIDLVKFRRIVSYYAYSAKLWGVTLFAATIALFGYGQAGTYLWAAIMAGVVSNIEGLAMKFVLPS